MFSKKRKAALQPKAAAFFARYLARRDGNTKNMETNTMKRVVCEGTADAKREEANANNVPENWCKLAEKNAARIQKRFKEENINVVVNVNQTFVNSFMDEMKVSVRPILSRERSSWQDSTRGRIARRSSS